MTPTSFILPSGSLRQNEATGRSLRARLERLSHRPLSFWFLNQWLEESELSRQIAELKDKGFGGFFLHPRGGLEVPYGSNRWFEVIDHCIREANRLGLEAWLYDEDPYPSGAAGGEVTLERPEFKAYELIPFLWEADAPGTQIFDLPPGMFHAVYLIDAQGIRVLHGEAGLVRTEWRQGIRNSAYYPPYEDAGTPHWRAEAYGPHYRIVTEVTLAPAKILAFVRTPIAQNPWNDFPDLLSPDAVDSFIRLTHQRYFERFPEQFGRVIPGIFSDESKIRGCIPWSQHIEPHLFKVCGRSLEEVLPHLVCDIDESTVMIRWAFREALAQTFLASFADRIKQACSERGLLWTGHFSPEEDPIAQALYVPGLFRLLTRLDIPCTDLIGGLIGNAKHPLLHLGPKIASSAAHISGKPLVGCEGFAVIDWVGDFNFMGRAVHWLYALGVNRLVTHGQFYSIDGPRKREAPPSQFHQASGWAHIGAFNREVEVLSDYLSRGHHVAPLLVYYPEEGYMAKIATVPGGGTNASRETECDREALGSLIHQLLIHGYDFDLIDAHHLEGSVRSDGAQGIISGEERYEMLLVPGRFLTLGAWETLKRLRSQEVPICFLEEQLTILADPPFCEDVSAVSGKTLLSYLGTHCQPLWKAKGSIIGHQRETKDGPLIFICNNDDAIFSGSVTLRFPGPYEVYDFTSGEWQAVGDVVMLELLPGRGQLIRQQRKYRQIIYCPISCWQSLHAGWSNWIALPLGDNCLVFDEFLTVTAPKGPIPAPLSTRRFQSASPVNLMMPCGTPPLLRADEDRHFQTYFNWHGDDAEVRLVCDTDLLPHGAKKWFWLNGEPLPPLVRHFTYDPMNLECQLGSLLREGRNTLHWMQEGLDEPAMPHDGLRLFGDFHVELPYTRSSIADLSRRPASYECGEPASPSQIGHRYFSGIMEYRATATIRAMPARVAIRFGKVFESIEIVINGERCGTLWGDQRLLEFSPSLLRPGMNEVILRCATSPANYLLGLNQPAGCLGPIEFCAPA